MREGKGSQSILLGQKIEMYDGILEDIVTGKVSSINQTNKYYIFTLPSKRIPHYCKNLFYEMQLMGRVPVIYCGASTVELLGQHEVIYDFVKKGAVFMVDGEAVVGKYGRKVTKLVEQLIEANLIHLITTENDQEVVNKAYEQIEKRFGFSTMYTFRENIEYLLKGEPLHREVPERPKKKKVLGIF